MATLSILYLDNHLLVVNKPAGLATMGVAADQSSLFVQAKALIKRRYGKPGNVYLGVVSRLDRPVSGVVAFARTSKAAARLSEQFRLRLVEKQYLAIAEKRPAEDAGCWIDWLTRDEVSRTMRVTRQPRPDAHRAEVRFTVLETRGALTLLLLQPITGRRHQLRAQLAAHGCPIVGDHRYGAHRDFPEGIALHAFSLTICHPTRRENMTLRAPVPACWQTCSFDSLRKFV
jgi:23S rRNA pseudouridine1911/1915/1917 synthase